MSAKNLDAKGRFRSETIAYRCSPEEREELDKRWRLLGYQTKQDYVLDAVLHNKVTAKGNPQMLVNFRKELGEILSELRRLDNASELDEELFSSIRTIIVTDFAGNITRKKLTSQYSLLTWFHTSIDRSSYNR